MQRAISAKPTAFLARPRPLLNMPVLGGGPAFRKAGKFPIYSREDLDAWANQRLGKLVRSTSELIDRGM